MKQPAARPAVPGRIRQHDRPFRSVRQQDPRRPFFPFRVADLSGYFPFLGCKKCQDTFPFLGCPKCPDAFLVDCCPASLGRCCIFSSSSISCSFFFVSRSIRRCSASYFCSSVCGDFCAGAIGRSGPIRSGSFSPWKHKRFRLCFFRSGSSHSVQGFPGSRIITGICFRSVLHGFINNHLPVNLFQGFPGCLYRVEGVLCMFFHA